MKYCVTSSEGGHGFKKNEVVTIVQIIKEDLFAVVNDEGKIGAVQRKQLVPYVKYPDNGNKGS